MKRIIILITLIKMLLLSTLLGQEKKAVNLPELYNQSISENLFPAYDTCSFREIFLFVKKPSFSPEFSLRMLTDSKTVFVESFFLDQSMWKYIVLTLNKSAIKDSKPEVMHYSEKYDIEFFNPFLEEMYAIYIDALNYSKLGNDSMFHFDGTRYYFRVTEGNEYEFTSHDNNPPLNEIVAICTKIAQRLKKGCFSESEIKLMFGKGIDPSSQQHLIDKMHAFFTSTLQYHYKLDDEAELYKRFLNEYYNSYLVSDQESLSIFSVPVNRVGLDSINALLFSPENYYFFYPKIVIIQPEDDFEEYRRIFEKDTEIPLVLIRQGRDSSHTGKQPLSFSKTHEIFIANENPYLKFIEKQKFKTSEYIINSLNFTGGIHYYSLATLFIRTNAMEELQYREVREILTVIFWKYLCLQAGVEFLLNDS